MFGGIEKIETEQPIGLLLLSVAANNEGHRSSSLTSSADVTSAIIVPRAAPFFTTPAGLLVGVVLIPVCRFYLVAAISDRQLRFF